MRDTPSEEEIEFYREQGFLRVERFLSDDELDLWRGAVDGAIRARGEARFATQTAIPDDRSEEMRRYYERVFTQRVNLWQSSTSVRDLMFTPELSRFAGRLAGVEGLRIWHDQALVKGAYANPTAFHLDVPYWSFTSPDAITIWVALDDATLENGCLYYVPGSHKAEKYDNVGIGNELGALFDVYPEWGDVPARPCPVPAGGAVVHNGLTFHGAGANMTPGLRRAMTCAYMPDGCTFNGQPNVLPPEYLARLRVGDLLDDEKQNPLVYRRR